MKVNAVHKIDLPKILDTRGNLSFLEGEKHVDFKIERAYWIYDVPGGEARGGHAYRELSEVIIAISGSFDVVVNDGTEEKIFSLNRSYYGIAIPKMIWRELRNFSTNSLALIVANKPYDESDYLRDFEKYKLENNE